MLRAFAQYHVAAANASARDLPYLGEMMATSKYASNVKTYPFLDRIVSANVVPASTDVNRSSPMSDRGSPLGKRLGSKPLRVGIVGVTENPRDRPARRPAATRSRTRSRP